MRKQNKKLITILSLIFVFTILQSLLIHNVFAETDTRTVISEVEATSSDIDTLAVYGEEMKNPTFTVTKGEPAYFYTGGAKWQKKSGETWEDAKTSTFISGTWRYAITIYIDNDENYTYATAGDEYKLAKQITLKVNGEDWFIEVSSIGTDYSCARAYSKEYNIDEPEELFFYDFESYDIPENYANHMINEFSVAKYTEGGTKPYTYSKKSGPDWINISNDGTISGTPTSEGTNSDLVVQAEDSVGNKKEITIKVGITHADPDNREVISEVKATSNIDTIATFGEKAENPTFNVTKGEPAYFYTGGAKWQKKEGNYWIDANKEDSFTAGVWRYAITVYIDNDTNYTYETAGNEYMLAKQIAVEVDGEKWEVEPSSIGYDYSSARAYSKEYVITESETKKFGATLYDLELTTEEEYKPVYVWFNCSEDIDPSKLNAEFIHGNSSAFEINLIKESGMLQKDGAYQNVLYVKPTNDLASGTYTATLKLSYDYDEDGTYEIDLGNCKVTYTAKNISISISPTSIDFGTLEQYFKESDEINKVVTVTNTGKVAITLKHENPWTDGPFGGIGYDTTAEIQPGEYLEVTLRTANNSPFAQNVGTYNGTYVFTATSTMDSSDTATAEVTAKVIIKEPYVYTNPFTDVKEGEWYYNAVKYAYENNMIKGYNATTFAPNDKLTRGQLVTILHRMEGSPKITGTSKFSDVKDSTQYYYNAVIWATNNKIVSGYDTGKFGPEDNITREQLAVILWKYAKYKGKNVSVTNDLKGFGDTNKISSWAVEQVKWAVGARVITGNNNTTPPTINPTGNATRAEVAAMLEKYCKKVANK